MTTDKGLFRPAASACVLALLVSACASNPRVTDTSGRKVTLYTPHVAEHHLSNGSIVIYTNSPDDINQLIRELQQLGVTDRQILSPEAWSQPLVCYPVSGGKCVGNCSPGACKLVGVRMESRQRMTGDTVGGEGNNGQVVPTGWRNIGVPLKWCACEP